MEPEPTVDVVMPARDEAPTVAANVAAAAGCRYVRQVIAEGRHRTSVRRMRGVFHRTKRDKHGKAVGIRKTIRMYVDLFGLLRPWGDIPWRAYWWYLRGLSIDRPVA